VATHQEALLVVVVVVVVEEEEGLDAGLEEVHA
jgi:hypothetical protein